MTILIAILIFLIVTAATWWFGLWSNLITLVNLILSALIASSVYQPVANQIIIFDGSFIFLADFIAVWVAFVLSYLVLRGITDSLSSYRLKFDPIVEMAGRSVLSLWVAGVFVCFSFFTMQMAPLSPNFYGDSARSPSDLPGTIPDRAWLAFIQSRSRGALAHGKAQDFMFVSYELDSHPDDAELDARVFDPFANFLAIAEIRRAVISQNKTLRISQGSDATQ